MGIWDHRNDTDAANGVHAFGSLAESAHHVAKATEPGASFGQSLKSLANAPGSGFVSQGFGLAGSALSALGFAGNVADMSEHGFDAENVVGATGNAAGVAAGLPFVPGPVRAVAGAYSAGVTLGQAGEAFAGDHFFDRADDGSKRGFSDLAAEGGDWVEEALGGGTLGALGGGATSVLANVAMAPAIAHTGVFGLAESLGRAVSRQNHPLLDDVGAQIAASKAAVASDAN